MSSAHLAALHPAIKAHLARLGIIDEQQCATFLYPQLADLPSPFLLKSMQTAVELILSAIEQHQEIIIWGDYDVDGITSSALLMHFFRKIGVQARCHIPNRLTEGYGLNAAMLRQLAGSADSTRLLITVDCGISNHEEILLAKELGFKVIVTDHHQVPDNAVPADAIINPKQPGCPFPCKELAGVGVAFYLAAATRSALEKINYAFDGLSKPNMKSFLDFVALGTIADIMPLTGVNRILARAGFEAISMNRASGIALILDELGIAPQTISSETVAYQVAPTINAAGRLGKPLIAFELLTNLRPESAADLAAQLVSLNKKRKARGKTDLETALNIVDKTPDKCGKCIVIQDKTLHDGLLGITAARLVELYGVPAVVCCPASGGDRLKGSARAPEDFDLFSALKRCGAFLMNFGGHKAAAGVTLHPEMLEVFRQEFEKQVINQYVSMQGVPKKAVFYPELSLSAALDPLLLANLRQLEPVGEGNPKPVFVDHTASFVSLNLFGTAKEHVRGVARGKFRNIPVIGFNLADKVKKLDLSCRCSAVYSHMLDNYNNSGTWKIRLEDVWQDDQQ